MLRAPKNGVSRRNSPRVDEGRKGWSILAMNTSWRLRTSAVEGLQCDPGPELRPGRR